MPTVERAGRTVHYTVEGSGPGLVLLPGIGSGARQFGTLPRRFARAGFTCAAVDPVGLPPSSALPADGFDFHEAGRDALAVAAVLPPPVSLLGTSLGGRVALCAAATAPAAIARLVLAGTAALRSARALRVHRWFEKVATATDPALFGDLVAPFLFGATFHAERPALVDDIVRAATPTPAALALLTAQARALQTTDLSAVVRACTVPTLCLGGAEDTLTPPPDVAATAALLPRAECVILPATGHSILLESPTAFDRVLAFLRESA